MKHELRSSTANNWMESKRSKRKKQSVKKRGTKRKGQEDKWSKKREGKEEETGGNCSVASHTYLACYEDEDENKNPRLMSWPSLWLTSPEPMTWSSLSHTYPACCGDEYEKESPGLMSSSWLLMKWSEKRKEELFSERRTGKTREGGTRSKNRKLL